jgi:hypothetical protein
VHARSTRDRLAVWTFDDGGEEIPCGEPSVTDAERAAAGRETVAERWRALLPGEVIPWAAGRSGAADTPELA